MHPLPTPPKGRRWLSSTRATWESWHTTGLADDWTPADTVQAEALLALIDDQARATSPTARIRLGNEIRQREKQLQRKAPQRKVKWEAPTDRPRVDHYDPSIFPTEVRGDSGAEIDYMTEMQAKFGSEWPSMARGEIPWKKRSTKEQQSPEQRELAPLLA